MLDTRIVDLWRRIPFVPPKVFTRVRIDRSAIQDCGTTASGRRIRLQDSGFTLIEILIVVAIVAILATIAWPSYQSAMRKNNRAAVESHLSDIAQRQQQFLLDQRGYAPNLSTLGVSRRTPLPLITRSASRSVRARHRVSLRARRRSVHKPQIFGRALDDHQHRRQRAPPGPGRRSQ